MFQHVSVELSDRREGTFVTALANFEFTLRGFDSVGSLSASPSLLLSADIRVE